MRLGSILRCAPIFILLLLVPLVSAEILDIPQEDFSELENFLSTPDSCEGSSTFNAFLANFEAQSNDFFSFFVVKYADVNTMNTDGYSSARMVFGDFDRDDPEDLPDAMTVELEAGQAYHGSLVHLLMIHDDIYDDIMAGTADDFCEYIHYDENWYTTGEGVGPTDQLWVVVSTTIFDDNDEEAEQAEHHWEFEDFQFDADQIQNQEECPDGGYSTTGQCCGDDAADQGSYTANYDATEGVGARETHVNMNGQGNWYTQNKFCSAHEGTYQWYRAEEHAGKVLSLAGTQIMSNGENWVVTTDPCSIQYYTPGFGATAAYLFTGDSGNDNDNSYDKNQWFSCADLNPLNTGWGGVSKVHGDMVTCNGLTYACAAVDGEDAYDWIELGDLAEAGDSAASCNAFGSAEGFEGYIWTGSRCCFGDQTYNDVYEPPVPGDEEEFYAEAGVCIGGRHFLYDNTVASLSQWLVHKGEVNGCGLTSDVMGDVQVPQNVEGAEGTPLVTVHDTCAVLTNSDPTADEFELENEFFCAYDGSWRDYNENWGEETLYELQTSPLGNLAPNPTFTQ